MKLKFPFYLGAMALMALWSCDSSDDNPTPDVPIGGTITAEMGSNMAYQVYIDLDNNETTKVSTQIWDIAFQNDGRNIRLNGAKKVSVAGTSETDLDAVTSTDGLSFGYDNENADLSESALAGWALNTVYVLDLGIDVNANTLGFKKFMITEESASSVQITFADLDGENEQTTTVNKGDDYFTFFSLINNEVVTVVSSDWDLVVTPVTVRTGAPCAALGPGAKPGINCDIYRLTASALSNNYSGTQVVVDDPHADLEGGDDPDAPKNQEGIESSAYAELTINDFNNGTASTTANTIGRNWLQILQPHSAGQYKVYDFITYMIGTAEGNYLKVRFLAFKGGTNVENGNPTIEFAELQ